jgi:hypothetical protein
MYIQHDSISCAPLGLEDAGIEVSRLRRRPRSGRDYTSAETRECLGARGCAQEALARMGPIRRETRWGRYTDRPRSVAITLNLPALARNSVCQRIVTSCRLSISTNVGLAEPCPKIRIRHRPADRSDTFTERYRNGRGQGWTRSVTRQRPRYRQP